MCDDGVGVGPLPEAYRRFAMQRLDALRSELKEAKARRDYFAAMEVLVKLADVVGSLREETANGGGQR